MSVVMDAADPVLREPYCTACSLRYDRAAIALRTQSERLKSFTKTFDMVNRDKRGAHAYVNYDVCHSRKHFTIHSQVACSYLTFVLVVTELLQCYYHKKQAEQLNVGKLSLNQVK